MDRRSGDSMTMQALSPGNRLFLLWPLISIVLLLMALSAFSLEVMSGARAYVSGESLWSKGQKQAVYHLLHYIETGEEHSWTLYLQNLEITLGDRRAREALDQPQPDRMAARAGFLTGGNDPADVDSLIRLYLWFNWVPPLRDVIDIWKEGDRLIAQLDGTARHLRAQMHAGHATARFLADARARIRTIDRELEPLAIRFSHQLGTIANRIHEALQTATMLVTLIALYAGVWLTRRMLRDSQRVEHSLRASEAGLREAQRLAHVGSWTHTLTDGATHWSEEASRIFNGAHWTLPDRGRYLDQVIDDDRPRIEALWHAALTQGAAYEAEYRVGIPGRGVCWIREHGHPETDDAGCIVKVKGTVMDVTERREAEERVRQLAHYDELTGLPNRTLFHLELQRALETAGCRGVPVALLFIDLDRFKMINDTLGHDAGDEVLVEVARRLRAALRDTDMVGRLGGDEFVVLATDVGSPADAAAIAQKVLDMLRQSFSLDGHDYSITASVGIGLYPMDGTDMQSLRKSADLAMYCAKEKGKNQFEFYAAYMSRRTSRQFACESELRRALEHDELVLHYQPRIALLDGAPRVVGAEALLRWQHPERGLVPPGHFIPVAEESGLIVPIGLWALETACREAQGWRQRGLPPISLSVNVSPRQLYQRDFVDHVSHALAATHFDPASLELEITESQLMDRPERSIHLLQALNALSVRVSIDDFGTGYSSLAYLRRFPIDCIKIDRAFVADLPDDSEASAITRAIIALAHSLQLRVVAEGVETAGQFSCLLAQDCDEFQGHLFARAMPAEQMPAFICRPAQSDVPAAGCYTPPRKSAGQPRRASAEESPGPAEQDAG